MPTDTGSDRGGLLRHTPIVKQRLNLASVAPALLDVFAEDRMALQPLMAFSVNPNPERQRQIRYPVKNSWNKEPYAIQLSSQPTLAGGVLPSIQRSSIGIQLNLGR